MTKPWINKQRSIKLWQAKHGLPNRSEPRGSELDNIAVAKIVEGRAGTYASLSCVVSVSVSSLAPVESRASERRVGRKGNPVPPDSSRTQLGMAIHNRK